MGVRDTALHRLDGRGRIGLPKQYRRELGPREKVLLIRAGDHLRLTPISDDATNALRGTFRSKKSFHELEFEPKERLGSAAVDDGHKSTAHSTA